MTGHTIQDWDTQERPREKFIERGAESLSNAELLAILIRSGNREENAIDLARTILNGAGNNLIALKNFSFEDFKKFKGIGDSKALSIMAAFELARRCDLAIAPAFAHIYSSSTASQMIIPILRDLPHEECWVLYLKKGNKLIGKERLSKGGMDATVVDLRLVIKHAMKKDACSIILAHNHPSGNIQPGAQDKAITKKLQQAAQMCDINLIDHIIVGGNRYFSFADEGLL